MKDLALFDFNDPDSDSSVITEPKVRSSLRESSERAVINVPESSSRGFAAESPAFNANHPVYFPIKHTVERVVAGTLLLGLSPIIVLLILLVRLTSKGPGIYRQERVGLDRKTFDVLKLRTMYSDAEADGQAKWCSKGDPRITPLGRFLRRTHLDELPQLWNVVVGDMSMTGPRPERPMICEKLQQHIPGYYRRTAVKPGITGLAQVNLEPDTTIDDVRRKQCLDLHYIQTAGPWLDLRMVIATCLRMFGIRGSVVMRWMGLCRKDVILAAGLPLAKEHQNDSIPCDVAQQEDAPERELESTFAVQSPQQTRSGKRHREFRINGKPSPK